VTEYQESPFTVRVVRETKIVPCDCEVLCGWIHTAYIGEPVYYIDRGGVNSDLPVTRDQAYRAIIRGASIEPPRTWTKGSSPYEQHS
jgi:hypothetical protein